MVRLEAAASADTDQALAAELNELLEDDRRAGATHARPLHGDRLALPRPGVAEQAALGVLLHGIVEVRLGDVLGAEWIAREQDGFRVVPLLGANVDRHGR